MRKLFFSFVPFIFVLFSFGQLEYERKITEQLCSDSLFGRGYVNDGVGKASRLLAKEFSEIGLQPLFGDEFYQPFSFKVNTFPGVVSLKIGCKKLTPGVDFLVNPNSGSVSGKLIIKELDYKTVSSNDLIIQEIVLLGQAKHNTFVIDLTQLKGKSQEEWKQQLLGLGNYANILFLTDEKLGWAVGRTQLKKAVFCIDKKSYRTKRMSAEVEAFLERDYVSKNVGALIPSKKPNAKTIVFTAHYDHLGGMGQKTFFPGANDNASGTVMLLSLAKYFVANPSGFNLIFVAFAGEEAGLIGSFHFVEEKSIDLSKIKLVLNLDIMGSGEDGITVVNGKVRTELFELLQKVNSEGDFLPSIKARGETTNSDHYPFHLKGVPAFFIYTRGLNQNYHDIYDTFENLTFSAYSAIINLLTNYVKALENF